MSHEKREVWSCDAPRCLTERAEGPEGELPAGFYGKVSEVSEDSYPVDTDWYACQVTHIAPAVRGALDRAGREALEDRR
jgi:hypothetical protein